MIANLAPGVWFQSAPPQTYPIAPARTDVAAFVGIAERGPVGTPLRVTSFKEFVKAFGAFVESGYLAYAVNAFFQNGGIAAWIVRTTAPAIESGVPTIDGASLTLSPPLVLRPGTVVALSQPAPHNETAVVMRSVVSADPSGASVVVDAPLAGVSPSESPPIDVGKPAVLSAGGVAARTTLLARNGKVAVGVIASSPGAFANRVGVRVLRQTVAQTSATASPFDGGRRVPVVSLAQFARGTFVRFRGGSLPDAYRVVCDVDAVSKALIIASDDPGRAISAALNVPLPPAFVLGPPVPSITIEALGLNVIVLENGDIVESYQNCSPLDSSGWNAQLSNALSRIIIDPSTLPVPSLDPDAWPADVDEQLLAGGTDGVRMLSAGDVLAALATLGPVHEPTLVAIPDACAPDAAATPTAPTPPKPPPDCTDPWWFHHLKPPVSALSVPAIPPQPAEPGPGFSEATSAVIAQGLVAFCDAGVLSNSDLPPHPSFRFALVDVPANAEPVGFRTQFDASRAAIHWPWVGVYDPLSQNGTVRFVPPSGHVAGSFAAMDLAVGAFRSAANSQLQWVADLAVAIDSSAQLVYNEAQVNIIRALPNRGIRIYGARTVSSDPLWLYVPVRRLVSMIENAILVAMQWAVFEPNSATLRALIRQSCNTLLSTLWEQGAFAGASASDAFYVICDGSNNPVSAQALGMLRVDIGVAPVRPAEFIVFGIGHEQDVLEIFEGSAA